MVFFHVFCKRIHLLYYNIQPQHITPIIIHRNRHVSYMYVHNYYNRYVIYFMNIHLHLTKDVC